MKRVLYILASLLALIIVAAAVLYFKGSARVDARHDLAYVDAAIPDDPAQVAHGAYLVSYLGCTGCHGADLAGVVMADVPPFRMVASNLTPGEGGVGATYTAGDWLRALREGVGPDGRGLYMMPSEVYHNLSDEDAGAIVAYLMSLEPIDNPLPETTIKPLGRFISAVDPAFAPSVELVGSLGEPVVMPDSMTTDPEWGRYRASTLCVVCHGTDLKGGVHPDPAAPPGSSLLSVQGWTLDGFMTAMRAGVTPSGRELDAKYMPYPEFGRMNDVEMEAIFNYLMTL